MKVSKGETCLYARNVSKYFPENQFLAKFGYESYLGVPLWDSAHRVIGHMVLVDDKPMSEDPLWISVLRTFASRAGVELEREQGEEKLRLALAEVESLKNRLQAENVYLQEEIRKEHNFEEMVGSSPQLLSLLRTVERIAPTDSTVLIGGETGTGKELIARAIHDRSKRKSRPLVKVNCGAITAGLVESELFGHVKGAFTGAIDNRVGRFELAQGGTLFLDEVGELPPDTQIKLLRVLQEHEFEPVGGNRTVRVDVRVIAATNRDLNEAMRDGRFRSDLFYRLNVVPLTVPSLRDRRTDIPQLVAFFLSRFTRKFGKEVSGVSRETMDRLIQYRWPGNIRELQNVIERAVVLMSGSVLQLDLDPGGKRSGPRRGAAASHSRRARQDPRGHRRGGRRGEDPPSSPKHPPQPHEKVGDTPGRPRNIVGGSDSGVRRSEPRNIVGIE
jgi:formate hydrogenlyase transcriptional activator